LQFPFESIALGFDFRHARVMLRPSLFKRGLCLRNRVIAPFPLLFPDRLFLPALVFTQSLLLLDRRRLERVVGATPASAGRLAVESISMSGQDGSYESNTIIRILVLLHTMLL
jgi:hypothetical protein